MRNKQLKFGGGFHVAFDVRDVQAAEMVIEPGGREGGPDNRHRGAEQWLFVVSGTGVAKVTEASGQHQQVDLRSGTLLVIERGERHEIDNTGDEPLKTLNVYHPAAFDSEGNPIGPGKD